MPPGIHLADPSFADTNPVDVIIGAEIFFELFRVPGQIPLGDNQPLLINSVFGWVVSGKSTTRPSTPIVVNFTTIKAHPTGRSTQENLASTDGKSFTVPAINKNHSSMASVRHRMNEDNEHPTKHDDIQPKQRSSMIIAPPASETHSSLRGKQPSPSLDYYLPADNEWSTERIVTKVQHHVHRSYLMKIRTTRATIPFRSQYHPTNHLFAELRLLPLQSVDNHQWTRLAHLSMGEK